MRLGLAVRDDPASWDRTLAALLQLLALTCLRVVASPPAVTCVFIPGYTENGSWLWQGFQRPELGLP